MLKKFSVVTLLSVILFFGGVFNSNIDASASSNQSQDQINSYKVYYSVNDEWKNTSVNEINDYINKFFSKWNKSEWNSNYPKEETVDKNQQEEEIEKPIQDEPKAEEPKIEEQEQAVEEVQPQTAPKEEEQNNVQSEQLSAFEQEVVELTNNERVKNGLAAFQIDTELSRVAREKSRDMSIKNYFDHTSPTYGSPFDMMQSYGINYRTAGENIAKGQRTPQEVVNGWMNSPGHRANIVNANFTHIGVGFVEQGNHWTQMFIGK